MNTRTFLYALLSAGVLAFFGYLLVSAIPLVAPAANKDIVVSFLENGRLAIVAFFGFLGAIVALLQSQGVKVSHVESEKDVSPNQQVADGNIERYKAKLNELFISAEKLKKIAHNNRHVAIKAMSYRIAVIVAVQFALCHIATAGIQGVIQKAYPLKDLTGFNFFIVAFVQTELLLLCSLLIPFRQHAKFISETRYSSQAYSKGMIFRIGGLGIFACGLISLVTLSPEQISTLLGNESLSTMPVLDVNYLAFLAATRLVIFPLIGVVGSVAAVKYLAKKP